MAQIQNIIGRRAIRNATQDDLLTIVWIGRASDPAKLCQQVRSLVESHLLEPEVVSNLLWWEADGEDGASLAALIHIDEAAIVKVI